MTQQDDQADARPLSELERFKKVAAEIVDDLFTNASGQKAERLLLWRDSDKRDLGGWGFLPLIDHLALQLRARLQRAPAAPSPQPTANGRKFSAWWMCFKCFLAFHVPTTGYFGDCPECHQPTLPCPVNPLEQVTRLRFPLKSDAAAVTRSDTARQEQE